MRKTMRFRLLVFAALVPHVTFADAYKCVDASGKISYQSKPCAEHQQGSEINFKTGGAVDKSNELAREAEQQELQIQQKMAEQQAKQKRQQLLADAQKERETNQDLIKNNPIQFTPYAIPPYEPEKLSSLVKNYQPRLPEIERMRRQAAQKLLSSGQCDRVESSELNVRSTAENLVILVDCSNGASAYFNEHELP